MSRDIVNAQCTAHPRLSVIAIPLPHTTHRNWQWASNFHCRQVIYLVNLKQSIEKTTTTEERRDKKWPESLAYTRYCVRLCLYSAQRLFTEFIQNRISCAEIGPSAVLHTHTHNTEYTDTKPPSNSDHLYVKRILETRPGPARPGAPRRDWEMTGCRCCSGDEHLPSQHRSTSIGISCFVLRKHAKFMFNSIIMLPPVVECL